MSTGDSSKPSAANSSANDSSPQQVVVHNHISGAGSRWFSWLGWTIALVFLMVISGMWASYQDYYDTTAGIEEKYHSLDKYAADKIAVISIEGMILDGDGYVKKQIDRVKEDESIKAVVVRVDSPGGTVTGSDYILHHLKEMKKVRDIPLVVSMGGMAASGGYYVSMAVGETERSIFAEPTTTTGSIGVIIPHYDLTGLMKEYNVKDDSIASGEHKQILSMTREMSAEDRKILDAYVKSSFDRFKSIIKKGRPIFQKDSDALDQLATGEIFTAEQAKKFQLIDEIGFIEDAIERALELAGLDAESTRVIEYKRPISLFSAAGLATQQPSGSLLSLLKFGEPRAYYLTTTLPVLYSSRLAD